MEGINLFKKHLSLALALVLVTGLFTGCGKKAADAGAGDQAATDAAASKTLVWNVGSSGPKTY